MSALMFQVTCPRCGHDVELITAGNGWKQTQKAVVRCTRKASPAMACGYRFIISTDIIHAEVTDEGEPSRCGTPYGYRVHMRKGTPSCDACREAHAEYTATAKRRRRAEIGMKAVSA